MVLSAAWAASAATFSVIPSAGLVASDAPFRCDPNRRAARFLLVVTLRSRRDAADTGTVVAPRGGLLILAGFVLLTIFAAEAASRADGW